jgi:hypothetical protein
LQLVVGHLGSEFDGLVDPLAFDFRQDLENFSGVTRCSPLRMKLENAWSNRALFMGSILGLLLFYFALPLLV